MTRRILAGVAASLLVLVVWGDRRAEPAPTCWEDQQCWRCKDMGNKTCGPTPEWCAAALGIAYDRENGATEQLDAFSACVGGER